MKNHTLLTILGLASLSLSLGACATERPGSETTDVDVATLSGSPFAALRDLSSFQYTATGYTDPHLEGRFPGDEAPSFPRTHYVVDVTHDAKGDRIRLDLQTETPAPGFMTTRTQIINATLGTFEGLDVFGQPLGAAPSDQVSSTRRQHWLLNPLLIMRDILRDPSLVIGVGFERFEGRRFFAVRIANDVHPVTLLFRRGRLRHVRTFESDFLLGDTPLVVSYERWRPAGGGLWSPQSVSMRFAGHLIRSEERSNVQVGAELNEELFEFAAGSDPQFDPRLAELGSTQSTQYQIFPPTLGYPYGRPAAVVPVELAPGVFWLVGTVHHSVAVEQENRIVLIEAPGYAERAEAILEWAASQYPDKPITHVVTTHHHVDHTAGLRTLVASGAKVVVASGMRDFYVESMTRPATIVRDALMNSDIDADAIIETSGPFALADDERPVATYPLENSHADDMLVAYLPTQKMLFNSDLYAAGFPISAALAESGNELNDFIVASQLDVELLVDGHGAFVATLTDFRNALGL